MQPTLLIGLDGATFTVLDALMAEGRMPNLRNFTASGVRAVLRSTPHPLTPPAWTTVLTGRNPGGHGIYDFLRGEVRNNQSFFTLNNFRDIQCETLWSMVCRQGGRSTGLNFPMMAPPPAINGSLIPGLLSWRHLRLNVQPPALYDELKALPGFNPRELSWDFEQETAVLNMPEEELEPWIRFHIVRERLWFTILEHLMSRSPADLTAVMFDGVDKLQHVCWRLLDPALTPAQPNEQERRLRDLCLGYFQELDGILGRIFQRAGPEANIVLVSDHGFGPCTHVFRVNKWLEKQGYLRWPTVRGDDKHFHFVRLDWEHTTAYAASAAVNGIHIRIQERPGGPGVPPSEYAAFRDRLVAELRALREPQTGRPFLKDVLRREAVFPGPCMEKAPDLTLVPFDHGFISVLDVEPIISPRPVTRGTHYPEGILLARGPAIRQGEMLPDQSIVDIAPTLLHSLGLPIPSDLEGKVIADAFTPELLAAQPVRVGPPTRSPHTATAAAPEEMNAEEEEVLMNRLRDLGYVE